MPDAHKYGETEFVVMRLTQNLEAKKHQVFFNNLFSSPDLMVYLKSQGIYYVATLQADRSRGCPIPKESVLKKKGRGHIDQFVDTLINLWTH